VVDNDPAKRFRGEDQQLDRAIQEIQQEMKTKGYQLPSPRLIRIARRRSRFALRAL